MNDQDEVELWLLWKRAFEMTRIAVVGEVSARTELNEPELTVLISLRRAGGTMRQNALAVSTGWDRTRLSHVLTRMATQGLISRTPLKNGVEVALDQAGTKAVQRSESVLAEAVREQWLGSLTVQQQHAMKDALERTIESHDGRAD